MRSIAIVATILAVSIAIPAGLLLRGTFTMPQLAEPAKEQNAKQISCIKTASNQVD